MLSIPTFRKKILDYYRRHGRHDLPWRKTKNSYHIFVSEIMLQQTQVSRVIPFYLAFIRTFPSFSSLARAPLSDVLKVWQGLGYNRRAKFLKQSAEKIMADHRGKLPNTHEELVTLPGIGPNTAGSLLAFAHDKPAVFIETNIRRVFIHHFFSDKKSVTDADLFPLVRKSLPAGRSREWYSALMDYGTHLATTMENPNRKSAHYTRQSTFKGSLRQIRGVVIKLLTEKPHTLHALTKIIPDPRLASVLTTLIAEHLIIKNKNTYRIA